MKLTKNGRLYDLRAGQLWESPLSKIWELDNPKQWQGLHDCYAPVDPRPDDRNGPVQESRRGVPWRRCLAVAKSVGAVVAVTEKRYVDRDYRSEYGALYSQVLAPIPDTAHRLHFFTEPVSADELRFLSERPDVISRLSRSYAGYIVCRPAPLELVGRTMLRPPDKVSVRSAIQERVSFFGATLVAEGVPFMQQDQRLGVCAHVSAWSLIYSADRCGDCAHHTIADVVRIGHGSADGRLGLTDNQIVAVLQEVGLRPQMLSVDTDLPPAHEYPWPPGDDSNGDDSNEEKERQRPSFLATAEDEHDIEIDIAQVVLPLLNSGISAYVGGSGHAFTICGYSTRNVGCADGDKSRVVYTAHDDQVGPYIQIYSPVRDFAAIRREQVPDEFSDKAVEDAMISFCLAADPEQIRTIVASRRDTPSDALGDTEVAADRSEWESLILPFPGNVHLSFRAAEDLAIQEFDKRLRDFARQNHPVLDLGPKAGSEQERDVLDIVSLHNSGNLQVRTYFCKSMMFKSHLSSRGMPDDVALEYGRCRFPANIHVVELIDTSRPGTEPRVIGEMILDSTSGDSHPWIHAVRLLHSLEITMSNGELLVGVPYFRMARVGFPGARRASGRSEAHRSQYP